MGLWPTDHCCRCRSAYKHCGLLIWQVGRTWGVWQTPEASVFRVADTLRVSSQVQKDQAAPGSTMQCVCFTKVRDGLCTPTGCTTSLTASFSKDVVVRQPRRQICQGDVRQYCKATVEQQSAILPNVRAAAETGGLTSAWPDTISAVSRRATMLHGTILSCRSSGLSGCHHAGCKGAADVLIKTHCWSKGWDPADYPCTIFVTHRDLAAVVASYQRLGWAFDIPDSYVADHFKWKVLSNGWLHCCCLRLTI